MAEETRLTISGNLTGDAEMRRTEGGDAVARFSVASTPRYLDRTTQEWKDGEALFMNCVAWRGLAENVERSFGEGKGKGVRVIVTGTLKQRSYETDDGSKRTVFDLTVEEIGASVRYATVEVTKIKKGGQRAPGDDDWNNAKKETSAAAAKKTAPAAAQRQQPAAAQTAATEDEFTL